MDTIIVSYGCTTHPDHNMLALQSLKAGYGEWEFVYDAAGYPILFETLDQAAEVIGGLNDLIDAGLLDTSAY